jgi:hypothetical protein
MLSYYSRKMGKNVTEIVLAVLLAPFGKKPGQAKRDQCTWNTAE